MKPTLLLILAPLFVHLLLTPWVRRRPVLLTALAAGTSLALTILLVINAPLWPQAYRIAWFGLNAPAGQPLVIGGSDEASVCGWPNRAAAPALTVQQAADKLQLTVTGGGAFVFARAADSDAPWQAINGVALEQNKAFEVKDPVSKNTYAFQAVERSWFSWSRPRFELSIERVDPSGRFKIGVVKLRAARSDGSVAGLAGLLETRAATIAANVDELAVFRQFAATVRIFIPAVTGGKVRLLPGQAQATPVPPPTQLRVRWAAAPALEMKLSVNSVGATEVEFMHPWRWTSKLPLKKADGQFPLITFAAQNRPGQTNFLLPVGSFAKEFQVERSISWKEGRVALADPSDVKPSEALFPPGAFENTPHKSGDQIARDTIPVGPYGFHTGIIYDLPSKKTVGLASLLAFAIFVFSLRFASARMNIVAESRAAAFGLTLVVWIFLCIRLLLAFRYGLEVEYVDALSVEGIVAAFVALAAAPALILLVVRLAFMNLQTFNEDRRRRKADVLRFLLVLVAGVLLVRFVAGMLWPSWSGGKFRFIIPLFTGIAVAGWVSCLLARRRAVGARNPILAIFFPTLGRDFPGYWKRMLADGRGFTLVAVLLFLTVVTWAIVAAIISRVPGLSEFVEEIWMPLGCLWMPAVFWLFGQARLAATPASAQPRWWMLFAFAMLLTPLCFALQVIGSRDAGTVYIAAAVLIALTLVLLFIARPRRLGLVFAIVTAVLFCSGYALVRFAPDFVGHFGQAAVRIKGYVQGRNLQLEYLFAEGLPTGGAESSGIKANNILNVYQHTRENLALAHEGGRYGVGFGEAPVRRSQVPMQTIQCDSVYSFYISSEHGYVGGLLLLCTALTPVGYVLLAARPKADAGLGIALVIGIVFALEVTAQAAMNLGVLPFTGRNLPLLTILSPLDLAKWSFLFAVAARCLFLRYEPDGALSDAALPLVSLGEGRLPFPGFIPAFALVLLLGGVVAAMGVVSVRVAGDKNLERPFTWDEMRKQIERLAELGYLEIDLKTMTLKPNASPPGQRTLDISEGRMLRQEIAWFNAQPYELRAQDHGAQEFKRDFTAIADLASFDRLMGEFRQKAAQPAVSGRPSVFAIEFRPYPYDDEEEQELPDDRSRIVYKGGEAGEWVVAANPAFNSLLNFHRASRDPELPQLTWRGAPGSGLLFGPAWSMGSPVLAFSGQSPVPWTRHIAEVLEGEWRRLGPEKARSAYVELSLSPKLQATAAGFVAKKGRAHYEQLLRDAAARRSSDPREQRERVPPRVALTVLNLAPGSFGEVLALGGWPRTSSSKAWERSGTEWLPPEEWLEQTARGPFLTRYAGERNFDRMLMGSSTKPLLASAALGVHPFLAKQLRTKGGDVDETSVFGIDLGKVRPWHASVPEKWRGFREYLAQSDNRYHVRLGFLALAFASNGSIVRDRPTTSPYESLDVTERKNNDYTPWRAAPKFPQEIRFSAANPNTFQNLHKTDFAAQLRDRFHVAVAENELRSSRVSFWTRDEADDRKVVNDAEQSLIGAMARWSPQTVQFGLDHPLPGKVRQPFTPRAYISFLLGGATNMWPNVDFAGAFASTVTGRPVAPHFIRGTGECATTGRTPYLEPLRELLEGLQGVVTTGTAATYIKRNGLLSHLEQMNVKVYAKTGTLEEDASKRKTSRLVMALVRWEGVEGKSRPKAGLVFSLVVEHAHTGQASDWLAEFLDQNRPLISTALEGKD